MSKYTLLYILWGSILFGLLFIEGYSPLFFLNNLQTDLTIFLVSSGVDFFNLPIKMQGSVMIFDNAAKIFIHDSCNGMTAILLYTAGIIAYPTWLKNKAIWFTGGYIFIVFLNILRLLFVSYMVAINPDYFHWSHDYIGRYGMGIFTLFSFFIFTQYVKLNKKISA